MTTKVTHLTLTLALAWIEDLVDAGLDRRTASRLVAEAIVRPQRLKEAA